MANLTETIQQTLGTNATTSEILASVILFVVVAVVGWAIYFVFNRYFSKWAEKTETTLDDDIIDTVKSFIVVAIVIIGIEFALTPLSFLQPYKDIMDRVIIAIEILLFAFATTRISNIIADWYGQKVAGKGKNRDHLLFILKKIIQVIIFIGALIIIIWINGWLTSENLTGATLGVGAAGIALAFALQSTLSDFFSAFSIYFDRPFEIGDFISYGEYSGTVTGIGIKSTRLRLLQGEELVIANKELTGASVRNFRKLQKRRVEFSIGVTYDTPTEKLKKIPPMIKDIISKVEGAQIERVHFREFGDFALKFGISYFVHSADYTRFCDIQQGINFAIMEEFEREHIEMAFPTSVVYVKKPSEINAEKQSPVIFTKNKIN